MLHALMIAAALLGFPLAQADDNSCYFAPPEPLLEAHAYAGQSFTPGPDQTAVELAELGAGVTLRIKHYACIDEIEREFVLTAPNDYEARGFDHWTDFARRMLGGPKLSDDAWAITELVDFLKTAQTMTPAEGVVILCRDGEVKDDHCSWYSGGTMRIEVNRAPKPRRSLFLRA